MPGRKTMEFETLPDALSKVNSIKPKSRLIFLPKDGSR